MSLAKNLQKSTMLKFKEKFAGSGAFKGKPLQAFLK
jgi:hypothetical protein